MGKEANPIPQGKYVPAVRFGDLVFTAGMTPRNNGVLIKEGKVLCADAIEDYRDAVRQAARNALTAAKNRLEEGEEIAGILSVTVYVNAEEGFTKQSKIADLAFRVFLRGVRGGRSRKPRRRGCGVSAWKCAGGDLHCGGCEKEPLEKKNHGCKWNRLGRSSGRFL